METVFEVDESSEERRLFRRRVGEIGNMIAQKFDVDTFYDFDMHENVAYARVYEYYSRYYIGKRLSVKDARDLDTESRRIGSFFVIENDQGGLVFDRIHGVDDIVRHISELMEINN